MVHKMPVPLEHTPRRICLGCVDYLVRLLHDFPINRHIRRGPFIRLGDTGEHQDQPYIWIALPQAQNRFGGKGVEFM